MTIEEARGVHSLVIDGKWVDAGNSVLGLLGKPKTITTKPQALAICQNLFQHLLDNEMYLHAATLQWGSEVFQTEPEGVRRSFEALRTGSTVLFMGASSTGKCVHPDTEIIMFDGSVKKAKHVEVGDKIMGDDSTARNVLVCSTGKSKMYRVVPERGEPWICNDAHILSLRVGSDKICGNSRMPGKTFFKGNVIDIPIEDYLKLSKDKKNRLKQFTVGAEFAEHPLEFDPYVYGSWIGDGGTDVPALHTPDGPMAREWVRYFKSIGYRISVGYKETSCPMWCARWAPGDTGMGKSNPFLEFIRNSSNSWREKFIRPEFLQNSRANRMKLLAGLIDSDGWVDNKTGYGFVSKFEDLARQVAWLARSLGFAATAFPKRASIKSIGFSAIYWNVRIRGDGVTKIPTLEKHCIESKSHKNLTNTGFTVEELPEGDYCGFVIDGNHRFLLGDFTVTHNTYGAGGWMLLDYLRDPMYTTVKLAAVNEDHLRKNLFAHVATLYRSIAIPVRQEIQIRDSDLWMGIKEAGYEFGISGIAFKQSQETSGQFKGYKAKPVRTKPHPKFGYMSRLRVLGDESQNWPNGPFKDFNSLVASKSGTELIKLAIAFNPESTSQTVVQMAEPEHGWNIEDLDTLYDYESKAGWKVCRLDAARCENVIQKKIVYPGLQTYEGFLSYLKAGGDSSSNFFTFARGFPPMKGAVNTIIDPSWPQEARGEAVFVDNPIILGAVDLAFMGKDSAQMAVARWGLASSWRDHTGKVEVFKDRLNIAINKPRHVLQIDQILPLQKHSDTIKMAEEIIGRCKMLRITPRWLALDKTSIGLGTYSHLSAVWGECFGVSWNEKATEMKILAEDFDGADKQVDGVMSEMWWAFRRWLEPRCRAIIINPIIPPQPIHTQLTSRRYSTGKKGVKVESKDIYKARNQNSPDEADALVMLVHLVRKNSTILPGLVEETKPSMQSSDIKFESLKSMKPIDSFGDSMQDDGGEDRDSIDP